MGGYDAARGLLGHGDGSPESVTWFEVGMVNVLGVEMATTGCGMDSCGDSEILHDILMVGGTGMDLGVLRFPSLLMKLTSRIKALHGFFDSIV